MLGDHSRDTASNALRKNYVGVRLRQGAPLLDSAFNEQSEIAHKAVTTVAQTVEPTPVRAWPTAGRTRPATTAGPTAALDATRARLGRRCAAAMHRHSGRVLC